MENLSTTRVSRTRTKTTFVAIGDPEINRRTAILAIFARIILKFLLVFRGFLSRKHRLTLISRYCSEVICQQTKLHEDKTEARGFNDYKSTIGSV